MKLKYYMRGIGVGIVFSVLVFSAFDYKKQQMTDAEIIEAAKELGMEEKKTIDLSALAPTPMTSNDQDLLEENKNQKNELDQQETQEKNSTDKAENSMDNKENSTDNKENSTNQVDNSQEEAANSFNNKENLTTEGTSTEENSTGGTTPVLENEESVTPTKELKTLVIQKGMHSHDVADLCESLGLVENAKEFDRYLIDQGYASGLRINRYEIPIGATYEEIAILITTTPQF